MTEEIVKTESQLIDTRSDLMAKVNAVNIVDQASYDAAIEIHGAVLDLIKEINKAFDEGIEAANKTHKGLIAKKREFLGNLPDIDKSLRRQFANWQAEQQRIRLENQRKAEAEARKKEEEERLKLAVQAAEQKATEETISEILETEAPIEAPVVEETYQKAVSYSKVSYRYSAEVINIIELCQAVVEKRAAKILVTGDQVQLNKLANALQDNFNVPGCRLIKTPNIRVRR